MLVDGAGQLKMTKDGKVLLSEMQIQVRPFILHPLVLLGRDERTSRDFSLLDRTDSSFLRRTPPPLSLPEQLLLRMR